MGQYTDKIRQITEDFNYIEDGEKCSSLQASDGVMIISYKHGGQTIEILRDEISYDSVPYPKGHMIYTGATDPNYIRLKAIYAGTPSWAERIAVSYRKIRKARNDKKIAKIHRKSEIKG